MQCKTTIAKKYDDGVIAGARCPNDAVKLGLCQEHLNQDIDHETKVRDNAILRLSELTKEEVKTK